MDDIATEIGVKPKLKEMFIDDPMLAFRCLFGPCVPTQYRLQGPGKWEGAKAAITGTMSRSLAPMKTRLLPKNSCLPESVDKFVISIPKYLTSYFFLAFVFFLFFCMVIM
jgi:dimethylaniline monooxygenase (N-oxide forming)